MLNGYVISQILLVNTLSHPRMQIWQVSERN